MKKVNLQYLDQKKMVSITTNGAPSMTGKINKMVSLL